MSKNASIQIICCTCKRSRIFHLPMSHYCRKKHEVVYVSDFCEDWLPSKHCLKLEIELAKRENKETK